MLFRSHKRTANDIWQSLYEFYLVEANEQQHWDETQVKQWFQQQLGVTKASLVNISPVQKQQLTHQLIKGQFIRVKLSSVPKILQDYEWLLSSDLPNLAFPKFINQYTELPTLQGNLF